MAMSIYTCDRKISFAENNLGRSGGISDKFRIKGAILMCRRNGR
jgi:hypothetical protein